MVDNSISPCERISGGFSPHSIAQIDVMLHPIDLSACTCFHLHDAAYCHRTGLFLTSFTRNMRIVALVAGDNTALPLLSTVGWFSLLPELQYAGGLVALPACSLALAAARTQPVAIRGDAQNDSKLATTRGGPRGVATAVLWPRYVVLTLPRASRTVRFTRSRKAVFSRPERPSPRPRNFEICLCPEAHHRRDSHQFATPVAFLHLTVYQLRRHLPPKCFPPSATHLKPVSKMGGEAHKNINGDHHS